MADAPRPPVNSQTGPIEKTNAQDCAFVIDEQLGITPHRRNPGPPERLPGMTLGIIEMTESAPHGGEIHPDGDELLYVISGRVRVTAELDPDNPLTLGPGESCIVRKDHWHRVDVLAPTKLLHATPGPAGDHRPLPS